MLSHVIHIHHHPTRVHAPWYWLCCQTNSAAYFASQEQARLHWYRTHSMPAVRDSEPDHTPTWSTDETGRVMWRCACRDSGRIGGYVNDQRARQSHTRHVQTALLHWYEHEELHARSRDGEVARIMQRWDGRTDKGREVDAQRLAELLI